MTIYKKSACTDNGRTITLTTNNGHIQRFHAVWLRDNAPDASTRSTDNGQKLLQITDIAHDLTIDQVELENNNVVIDFHSQARKIAFSAAWLNDHCYDHTASNAVNQDNNGSRPCGWLSNAITTWGNNLAQNIPTASFDDLLHDDAILCQWLSAVARYGIATVSQGPLHPQSLLSIAARFGYVRETNYGKWFDVRTESRPTNLAYTGLGLQAHTDNPYRDPVPTLQILYCLENSTDGGHSLVVDGFHAAQLLREESERDFDLLCRHNARFEYAGSAHTHLIAKKPMIELGVDNELTGVRFNNRSCTALTDIPFDEMTDYYAAYQRFSRIIDRPSSAVQFRLQPGECFIVDNTRVLHGRTAYTSAGSRWLQGCYPDKDGLLSTLSVLQQRLPTAS